MSGVPFVPRPSGECRCGRKSVLRLVEVRHRRSGHTRLAPFSEVGHAKTEDKRTNWDSARIEGEWEFFAWFEICTPCYFRWKDGEAAQQPPEPQAA